MTSARNREMVLSLDEVELITKYRQLNYENKLRMVEQAEMRLRYEQLQREQEQENKVIPFPSGR